MSTEILKGISRVAAALLEQARDEYAQAGECLAVLELDAAAHITRHMLGSDVRATLVEKDNDSDGDTRITTLVVFGDDNEIIWFNDDEAAEYPGALELLDGEGNPDVPANLQYQAEAHLERAYDLLGGCGLALNVAPNEHFDHFDEHTNLLLFDITAALP